MEKRGDFGRYLHSLMEMGIYTLILIFRLVFPYRSLVSAGPIKNLLKKGAARVVF